MRFRLLGPVEIEAQGRLLPIARRRERCLLAVLLLKRGRTVPVERLCELLWEGDPPEHARRSLHSHVARLRGLLTDGAAGVRLTGGSAGYTLYVEPYLVDVHLFRQLVAQAREATDTAARISLLGEALRLWRGPALQGRPPPPTGWYPALR